MAASGWIIQKAGASTLLLAIDIILESLDATSLSFGDITFLNPPATTETPGVVQLENSVTSPSTSKALTAAQGKKLQDEKQPLHANLTALAALVGTADKLPYFTGAGALAMATLSAFARTLLDDANATAALATLGAAPLNSAALTGTPTAPTAAAGTNTAQVATTAFVAAVETLLNAAIALKAPLASPALTGTPTAPTAAQATNNTQLATTAFVKAAIAALVDSSPGALDTLNELAAALGDDPNFATTMTNALALKAPLGSPALTGTPTAPTAAAGTNTAQVATTAFVAAVQTLLNTAIALKAPLASPALTGTPTAPTAAAGTDTTQLATTAFVQDAVGTGAVQMFARSTAPTGWLKANGATISRTTYAALFAAIGTTFGAGDGSTTFNLPDLRGEFLRGWDDARGADPSRVFGSFQDSDNKSHAHTASTGADAHTHTWSGTTASAGDHTHGMNYSLGLPTGGSSAVSGETNNGVNSDNRPYTISNAGAHTHTVSGTTSSDSHTHTVTVAASGGTQARPRNIALLACIKY